jgi:hypothetical protein
VPFCPPISHWRWSPKIGWFRGRSAYRTRPLDLIGARSSDEVNPTPKAVSLVDFFQCCEVLIKLKH